jgi:hypothetical protein
MLHAATASVLQWGLTADLQPQNPNMVTNINTGTAKLNLVPINLARQIASHRPKDSVDIRLNEDLSALPTRPIESEFTYKGKDGYPDYYAFNYSDGGFILIGADLKARTILAHAEKGVWGKTTFPDGVRFWMGKMTGYIDFLRRQLDSIPADRLAVWSHLLPDQPFAQTAAPASTKTPDNVPPAKCTPNTVYFYYGTQISTSWGQGCGYNSNCPGNVSGPCQHDLTGCAATALAQVAYYFKFPTRYNYASMPLTAVNGSINSNLQGLMSDMGSYVNMQYGPYSSDAYDYSIVPALQNSLGYTSARLIAYNDNAIPTIQNDIRNLNEPVLFIGWDNSGLGGHIWVGDGYAIASILNTQCIISYEMAYYHMNWGWGEIGANNYIGWYNYYIWAVDGYDFGTNTEVVLDIHP